MREFSFCYLTLVLNYWNYFFRFFLFQFLLVAHSFPHRQHWCLLLWRTLSTYKCRTLMDIPHHNQLAILQCVPIFRTNKLWKKLSISCKEKCHGLGAECSRPRVALPSSDLLTAIVVGNIRAHNEREPSWNHDMNSKKLSQYSHIVRTYAQFKLICSVWHPTKLPIIQLTL